MLPNQIYILSQPIQTGKTTLLQQWIKPQHNVGGILTPDLAGVRKLLDISTQTYYNLQLTDEDEGIKIGRFVFDTNGFKRAQQLLLESLHSKNEWVIVDEVGRLELDRNEGLEPALSVVINHFKTTPSQTKLLLVVRDYLLEEVKKKYNIEDAEVLPASFFKPHIPLTGIVLCGGQSVRMGRDKAFIQYHNTQQYAHVAGMMQAFCNDVVISCNTIQYALLPSYYKRIIDSATYENAGPLTGVLSVVEHINDAAFLVMGCDYPYFTSTDMKSLIDARDEQFDVVCYHNSESGFDEPLLAVYEKQCAGLLLEYFNKGNTSLQQFLKTVRTKRVSPTSLENIRSIDL